MNDGTFAPTQQPSPPRRCQGVNEKGDRCARELAEDQESFCLHHGAGVEPKWRFPWTPDHAKYHVVTFDPRYAAEHIVEVPRSIEQSARNSYEEARHYLGHHAAEWLEAFDAHTLPAAEHQRTPWGLQGTRPVAAVIPAPPLRIAKPEPPVETDGDNTIEWIET